MVEIYASDLKEEKQNDAFMGEGFEEMLKKAEEENAQLIIGEFCKNENWRIE